MKYIFSKSYTICIYLNGDIGSQSLVNGGGDVFLGEGVDDSNGSKVLDAVEHLGLQFQKRFGPAESSLGSACKIIHKYTYYTQ